MSHNLDFQITDVDLNHQSLVSMVKHQPPEEVKEVTGLTSFTVLAIFLALMWARW